MKKILYIISDLLIAALLAGAYVLQYFAKRNREQYKKIVFYMVIVSVVLAVFYLGFTFCFSQEKIRAYYLALPLIGLANVVQLIKTFTAMKLCKVRKL